MINTKLVIELEKLFKEEPFNLENTIFRVKASYGSIEVDPDENYLNSLEEANYELVQENDRMKEREESFDDEVEYYRSLLDSNDIDYQVF